MSKPNIWDKITAFVAKNKLNTTKEAKILQKAAVETLVEDANDDLVDDRRLDCICDDEPLGFEEDPLGSTTKMRAPTYVRVKITKEFRDLIVELLKEYKDCFEMSGLSREMVELKLSIRPDKKPVKQIPRRFVP